MSHTRPNATGWVTGQAGDAVEIQADPPGDGIGPDLTPPDKVDGQDPREYRRLEKDHRAAQKDAAGVYDGGDTPELFESAEEPRTPHPFPDAVVREPQDPQPEDPRVGKGDR